ncbi:MAG: hypothetical protein AB8B73_12415 [Ekhidna sp.]
MGHKTLSDKLDKIKKEDLGIHFDQALLWEDLSMKLETKKKIFTEKKLMLAACITLLILFLPMFLMRDTKPGQLAIDIHTVEDVSLKQEKIISIADNRITEKEEEIKKTPIYSVSKKSVSLALANPVELGKVQLLPIQEPQKETKKGRSFADQDISIIQASLGTPSIGREKSVSLRAQLHTSSKPVQLNNQALKIKLFERSNQ